MLHTIWIGIIKTANKTNEQESPKKAVNWQESVEKGEPATEPKPAATNEPAEAVGITRQDSVGAGKVEGAGQTGTAKRKKKKKEKEEVTQ